MCIPGQPVQSFVPDHAAQLYRRDNGTGGTYDPRRRRVEPAPELLDYGVISGCVAGRRRTAEATQLPRSAHHRGLDAQGYMIGTARTSQPARYPSIATELAPVLSFLPVRARMAAGFRVPARPDEPVALGRERRLHPVHPPSRGLSGRGSRCSPAGHGAILGLMDIRPAC